MITIHSIAVTSRAVGHDVIASDGKTDNITWRMLLDIFHIQVHVINVLTMLNFVYKVLDRIKRRSSFRKCSIKFKVLKS